MRACQKKGKTGVGLAGRCVFKGCEKSGLGCFTHRDPVTWEADIGVQFSCCVTRPGTACKTLSTNKVKVLFLSLSYYMHTEMQSLKFLSKVPYIYTSMCF